jgi:hypothetical protein
MNLKRLTLNWALLIDKESKTLFGTEKDVDLRQCHDRIRSLWRYHNIGVEADENPPYMWAYSIKDEHGHTFTEDWCIDGFWPDLDPELEPKLWAIIEANGMRKDIVVPYPIYPVYGEVV